MIRIQGLFICITCVLASVSFNAYGALHKSESDERKGKDASAIQGSSVQGDTVNLPLSGKPTAVLFFASWCPPCQLENDSIKALYKDYTAQGIQIVAIAVNELQIDNTVQDVKPWVTVEKIPYPVLIAEKKTAAAYGFKGIPTLELVDRNGKVVKTLYGLHTKDEIEAEFKALLTAPAKKLFAQSIVEAVAAKDKRIVRVGIHAVPPGGTDNLTIAATAPEKIGKKSDPEDLKAMETGKPVTQKEGDALDITLPLHDAKGTLIGAIGITLKMEANSVEAALLEDAQKLVIDQESRIDSAVALFEQK